MAGSRAAHADPIRGSVLTLRCRTPSVARGIVFLLALLMAVFLRPPNSALAHALLVRSDPPQNARLTSPPQRIDLFFSEALNRPLSTVHLLDTSGRQQPASAPQFTAVPTEMFVTVGSIGPGYYTVSWVTVSAIDGHRWDGTFPITVLEPDGAAPPGTPPAPTGGSRSAFQPVDAAIRWLLLLGLIGVTGGFGFATLVLWPAAGALAEPLQVDDHRDAVGLAERVAVASVAVVLLANLALLLRQTEQYGAVGAALSGRTGAAWASREALALAGGAVAWIAAQRRRAAGSRQIYPLLLFGLVLSIGGLATMSLTSHAAAGRGADWATLNDLLHVTAVALWLGCLVQLPCLLRGTRIPAGEARICYQGAALRRFSILAAGCVAAILVTGSFSALVEIPSLSALLQTQYGRTLLIKGALIVPLLGLGLLNATWVSRRFVRGAVTSDGLSSDDSSHFLRRAVAECVAGALVLAATAVLVNLVPASAVEAQNAAKAAANEPAPAFQQTAKATDLIAEITVTPNQVGENTFEVQLTGSDLDKIERVQFRLLRSGSSVGRSTLDAQAVPGSPGLYTAAGANLSLSGRWQVTVNVLRTGHDDVNATVTDALSSPTGDLDPTAFPASGVSPVAVIVALGVLGAWLALLFLRPTLRRPPALLVGCTAPAALLVAFVAAGALSRSSGMPSVTTHVLAKESNGLTTWAMPAQNVGLMMPTIAPDGNVWIGEMNTNKLAVLKPSQNVITQFGFSTYQGTMGIAVDKSGVVWLAQESAGTLGRFDPASGRYTAVRPPTPNSAPSAVALAANGDIWFTEANVSRIARFDPKTQTVHEFPLPHGGAVLYWLAVAADGRVWFTEFGAHLVGVLDPTSGAIREYAVPSGEDPAGITIDASGTVWFATTAGSLVRLDSGSGTLTRYKSPVGQLYGVVAADGRIWAGSASADAFVSFNPGTDSFTQYPVPAAAGPWWPAVGAGGSVWVALGSDQGNALAKLTAP